MQCPGQDRTNWKDASAFDVPCPCCGTGLEFFRDEASRRCPQCGHKFANPRSIMGCAEWCAEAERCTGLPLDRIPQAREARWTGRLMELVERQLGGDSARMAYALLVLQHARAICGSQEVDVRTVLAAAILAQCDLWDHGPDVEQIGFDAASTEQVCCLLDAYRQRKNADRPELDLMADAGRLAKLTTSWRALSPEEIKQRIEVDLATAVARERARQLFHT